MKRVSRRRFIVSGSCAAAGLLGGSLLPGCKDKVARPVPREAPPATRAPVPAPAAETTYVQGSVGSFPYLEVSGTPREVGRAIGRRFGPLIRKGLERRAEWFGDLRSYARGSGSAAYEIFVSAARKHTPRAFAELEGWAEGSGIAFEDLMVLNLKSELAELMRAGDEEPGEEGARTSGCSTLVVADEGGFVHVHNEDGHEAYADLMFVLKVKLTDGVPYLCLSYPGVLPGNAPGINARGVVQTTNFIGAHEVRLGVGRYFLDRMIYEARDLDEALKWATHPDRAFAFHHVLSSVPEKRALSVEVTPSAKSVREIEGLFVHTNHLLHEGMRDEDQDEEYVASSSMTRYRVLSEWAKGVEDPAGLGAGDLVDALSLHEGAPYSPCRHPEGDVHGFTLATATFRSSEGDMRLHKNQPCLGRSMEYEPLRPEKSG